MKIVVRKEERTINITGGAKVVDMSGGQMIVDGKVIDEDFGQGRIQETIQFNGSIIKVDAEQIVNIDHIDTLIL